MHRVPREIPQSPSLSEHEWDILELFLECDIRDREHAQSAFWEETFANERVLGDTYKRLAWLGDRVLNLALADRREIQEPPTRPWNGTAQQTHEQSGRIAAEVARSWPPEIVALLRLGVARRGLMVERMYATYAEALVGLVFREQGYAEASAFVWKHWLSYRPNAEIVAISL